jgi:hypothetical protein
VRFEAWPIRRCHCIVLFCAPPHYQHHQVRHRLMLTREEDRALAFNRDCRSIRPWLDAPIPSPLYRSNCGSMRYDCDTRIKIYNIEVALFLTGYHPDILPARSVFVKRLYAGADLSLYCCHSFFALTQSGCRSVSSRLPVYVLPSCSDYTEDVRRMLCYLLRSSSLFLLLLPLFGIVVEYPQCARAL